MEERTKEKIIEDIKNVINKIRPYLNSEGGDIDFIEFIDGVVYVKMLGACEGCGSLDFTLKEGIESLLVEYVPEVTEVRQVEENL